MIASKYRDFVRILDFETHQKSDGLNAKSTSINIVSQKKIGGVGRISSVLKQSEHVLVLAVNVTADSDWCLELY